MFQRTFQAAFASVVQEMHLAVYAGEVIAVHVSLSGIDIATSGYLFEDVSGRDGPLGEISYWRPDVATPSVSEPAAG